MDEFAQVLRAWRDRVTPEQVGMPPGLGRRAPGLRREELALLAGVSVDYIVRLEQGRARNPSPQLLGALARALRLDEKERDHLYRVAGAAAPMHGAVPRQVSPTLQRMVDRLGDVPVSVHTAAHEMVLWNRMWVNLFGDPSPSTRLQRNIVWSYFAEGPGPVVHTPEGEEQFASDLVGHLRNAAGHYPEDPEIPQMVEHLSRISTDFARRWAEAPIGELRASRKTVHTAQAGPITLDCDMLSGPDNMLVVVMTAAPGSEDERKLRSLAQLGVPV